MKTILIDTHILLWWLQGNELLSDQRIDVLEHLQNQILVSTGSLWEMYLKKSLGKLAIPDHFDEILREINIEVLPIKVSHLEVLMTLPFHHRDPFDRLLVAQAIDEGVLLMSSDRSLRDYEVELL